MFKIYCKNTLILTTRIYEDELYDDSMLQLIKIINQSRKFFNSLQKIETKHTNKVNKLKQKIELLETELKCVPGYGEYYKEALSDFTDKVNQ